MRKIKPQRINSAKSFVTRKYNKSIWTCRNTNDIGLYLSYNSSYGGLQSASLKCSSRQLRQYRAVLADVDGSGTANWRQNQYQHQQFKPFVYTRKSDADFDKSSNNGISIINDTNTRIYFGSTNHWLIPNNGFKIWQKIDDTRLNDLNTYAGLLNSSYIGQRWYKPKGALSSGSGYSGMRYEYQRPYSFNLFVDYSTSAAGPCGQDPAFSHSIQKLTDIYNKTRKISKFKLKDGVNISNQRAFKSLRRTNTIASNLSNFISGYSNYNYVLNYIQSMNDTIESKILVLLAAKSNIPMILKLKVQLYDTYYQDNRSQMFNTNRSINGIYANYNQAFCITNKQSPNPTLAASSTGISSSQLNLNLDNNWRLHWAIIPFKISGVQRGINDIIYHAGRQLVNIDKFKISIQVPRSSRNREFYVDILDAIVSQQITYSTNNQRPITTTSTIFNGNAGLMSGDSRSYRYGYISQSQMTKRNTTPYLFKTDTNQQKLTINYRQTARQNQVSLITDMPDQTIIQINNFRNTKICYEVF